MHRPTRALLFLTAALGVLHSGAMCGTTVIAVSAPTQGSVVTTFSFGATITLSGSAVPSTLVVLMNGEDITSRFTLGGPGATATIDPGFPLLDHVTLTATVDDTAGRSHWKGVEFDYLPPKARVKEITSAAELLPGPLAQGRIGDFLLENDVAAFVVQDVAQRDFHSVGHFGGNLIDAVRKAPTLSGPGSNQDHFFEIQAMANIETVLNAQTVEIVNDGQDGTPAILRVTGPDDIWDLINPSAFVEPLGVSLPATANDVDQPIIGTTDYTLLPGKPYVRIDTTWTDTDGTQGDIGMYVGDYMNGMGEMDSWIPSFGIGESLVTAGLPWSGPGFVNLFRTKITYSGEREALGASYGYVPIEIPASSVQTTSFTTSGVTAAVQSNSIPLILQTGALPVLVVPEGGSATHSRYFVVGTGDGGSIIEQANDIFNVASRGTLRGCVTVGGVPVGAGAEVAVDRTSATDTILRLDVHYQTREDGCYGGTLPAASYRVAANLRGAPYQGGGTSPVFNAVSVTTGNTTVQDIALPATGRLHVTVTDEDDDPVPARVTVIGADPSPPVTLTHNTGLGAFRLGLFEDGGYFVGTPGSNADDDAYGKDPLVFGVVATEFIGASGEIEFPIEPGDYRVAVSRGTEYSARFHDVSIAAGETELVTTQIARVLDTPGFVSGDYHVHLLNSPDSFIGKKARILSIAAEGVENLISTEHDAHTPLNADIAALGLGDRLHSTLGEEITSDAYGHFNAYPLDFDPSRVSGGSTDWGGAAPPGEDFVSLGSYTLSPAEIDALVHASNSSPNVAVQINHISSHFEPLRIDTGLVPPASGLSSGQIGSLRLDPTLDPDTDVFHLFDALELWNGFNAAHEDQFLLDRIGIWMNHLNQGLVITAIADTDTHALRNTESGGARTWTPSSSDLPAGIDDEQVGAAVKRGLAVGGQGIYVQARLVADSTTTSTGFAFADPTLSVSTPRGLRQVPGLSTTDGTVHLDIDVQAPLWAPFDTIEIFVNHAPVVSSRNVTTPPTLYGTGTPEVTLAAGVDFTITEEDPYAGAIPDARRKRAQHRETLSGITEDSWIVVVVKGSPAVAPMFPVFPGSLRSASNVDGSGVPVLASLIDGNVGEGGTRALGFTNALYVDVGSDGDFDPPVTP